MASAIFFSVLLASIVAGEAQQNNSNLKKLGSSLSPSDSPWHSPSRQFAFGFYSEGNGFLVGIWLADTYDNSQKTIVWTANRNDPPASSDSKLEFADGTVFLRAESSARKIIAVNDSVATFAAILDSGNFVLYDKNMEIIWQSFEFPTDTLLGGQILSIGSELVSSFSQENHSSGRFRLVMQDDGNLVIYPMNSATPLDASWASGTNGDIKYYLYLNNTGKLELIGNNSSTVIAISKYDYLSFKNNSIIYRATIRDDGNFLLYSHVFDTIGHYNTSADWQKFEKICEVKGYCGFNSYCTMNDVKPSCMCLPGTHFIDANQSLDGCESNFTKERCESGRENTTLYTMFKMEKLKLDDAPYFQASIIEESCSQSCLEDCDCNVALFKSGNCRKYKSPVRYVARDIDASVPSSAYFKMGNKSKIEDNNLAPLTKPQERVVIMTTNKKAWMLILVVSLGLVTYSCGALAISGFFMFKSRVMKYKTPLESGTLGLTEEFTLRPFTYKELAKATNGFKEELGKGSFGTVYKGSLYKSKKLVAVKRLEKVVDEGEREFRAEMLVIGRTHHKNLVRLLGYCAEGIKRLLVYEYMSNGTLADLLFRSERRPDWNERIRIALDIAKGILYLHEECEAPIIHCDIKPHNILMDDFWTAKISDFGLAKLLMPDQTRTFTGIRGTRGYLAPEWQLNIPISVKVDIFSFGIMLLEIVCCRRNLEVNEQSKPEEIVLSTWAYKCFISGELHKLVGGDEVDKRTLERMVKVGLWCIQDEPALRPSMKSVMLILEGMTDIAIPPCPSSSSL